MRSSFVGGIVTHPPLPLVITRHFLATSPPPQKKVCVACDKIDLPTKQRMLGSYHSLLSVTLSVTILSVGTTKHISNKSLTDN